MQCELSTYHAFAIHFEAHINRLKAAQFLKKNTHRPTYGGLKNPTITANFLVVTYFWGIYWTGQGNIMDKCDILILCNLEFKVTIQVSSQNLETKNIFFLIKPLFKIFVETSKFKFVANLQMRDAVVPGVSTPGVLAGPRSEAVLRRRPPP